GKEGGQRYGGIEMVDDLGTNRALSQHETHGRAGAGRILPNHLDECGLITSSTIRRRHGGNDRKPRLGPSEIVTDTVVARLVARTALSRIGEHEFVSFLDGIDRVGKGLG